MKLNYLFILREIVVSGYTETTSEYSFVMVVIELNVKNKLER